MLIFCNSIHNTQPISRINTNNVSKLQVTNKYNKSTLLSTVNIPVTCQSNYLTIQICYQSINCVLTRFIQINILNHLEIIDRRKKTEKYIKPYNVTLTSSKGSPDYIGSKDI